MQSHLVRNERIPVGPRKTGPDRFVFTVWAPKAESMELELVAPMTQKLPMQPGPFGYFTVEAAGIKDGQSYAFMLDGKVRRADPASRLQEETVHGPSVLVDEEEFEWTDRDFVPVPYDDLIIYELHVGTFTPSGDFAGAEERLDYLVDLGVNCVELLPVAQFPGSRNWGYDGVYPYAVQNSYGGPKGLQRFVDACHDRGLSVIMDVVYNHLGPEGNYLRDFGPYFTDRYKTPWGEAVNYDGQGSDGVRNYFAGNAAFWFDVFHIDGLRLDAVHAIYDMRPLHILQEIALVAQAHAQKRGFTPYLIAETHANDPRLAAPLELNGYGMDGFWSDDFHHAVHTLLTGEKTGYYEDYGKFKHLVDTVSEGFAYRGEYSPFRKRSHGLPCLHVPPSAFVQSLQTHDQVGNRLNGDRLAALVPYEALKVSAALFLLAPYTPMLFMGEEYGEDAPFLYFISHGDEGLVDAVRKGRKREFKAFAWKGEPPDPQSEETFEQSRLDWGKIKKSGYTHILMLYTELLRLRKELGPLKRPVRQGMKVVGLEGDRILFMERSAGNERVFCFFNFSDTDTETEIGGFLPRDERLKTILDTADERWNGPGSLLPEKVEPKATLRAYSAVVYYSKDPAHE